MTRQITTPAAALLPLAATAEPIALKLSFHTSERTATYQCRKFSGAWTAATWIGSFGAAERQKLDRLKTDPERKVVAPSPSDFEVAQLIYRSMIDAWAKKTTETASSEQRS